MKNAVLLAFLLSAACSGLSRPSAPGDAGPEGVPIGSRLCSPWSTPDSGSTLATDVADFTAGGDVVVFSKVGLPSRVFARRLSTGMERELFSVIPKWESRPSQNRIFELALTGTTTTQLVTFDLQTLDVETCTRSRAIAESLHGPPSLAQVITAPAFCDSGFVWVAQSMASNSLNVSGLRPVNAPMRGNLGPACANHVLTWWSTDSESGEPGFINWARTDVDESTQRPTEGRVASSKGLAISAGWTVWVENNSDGGSSVRALELGSIWDGGAPRLVAAEPFTRYDAVGLRGDLATWRERSGNATRLVLLNLSDGGVETRDVASTTQHVLVEHGVVLLNAGTLTWDPGFAP